MAVATFEKLFCFKKVGLAFTLLRFEIFDFLTLKGEIQFQ